MNHINPNSNPTDHHHPVLYLEQTSNDPIEFDFPFPITEISDIHIAINGVMLDVEQYHIQGIGQPDGVHIQLKTAPHMGDIIAIWRELTPKRNQRFIESGELRAQSLNDALDRLTYLQQDLWMMLHRCLRLDMCDHDRHDLSLTLPVAVANRALVWNDQANAIMNSDIDIQQIAPMMTRIESYVDQSMTAAKTATDQAALAKYYSELEQHSVLNGTPCFYGFSHDDQGCLIVDYIRDHDDDQLGISHYLDHYFTSFNMNFYIDDQGYLITDI